MSSVLDRPETAREHLLNAAQVLRAQADLIDAGCVPTVAEYDDVLRAAQERCAAARRELDRGNV